MDSIPASRARIGAHMPTAGGLHNALYKGKEAGCDIVQIFTKTPQQWKSKEITDEQVELFLKAQEETGIPCLASHDSYLINPCAPGEELLEKSRAALADELSRCALLRIPFVVMHQGSLVGAPEAEALARLIDSVKYVLDRSPESGPGSAPTLLLEMTAGQGQCMGHRFEQVAAVIEGIENHYGAVAADRLGVCLDTCHIFAAGYDLRTPEAYAATMEEFDLRIGLRRVRFIHANDSKKELGSRVDRHEHIGQGHIGPEAFRLLLSDPRLAHAAVALETPKDDDMDIVNLAALRAHFR